MRKLMAKTRTIYDNYDLWEVYPDEYIKENLIDNGMDEDEITDDDIMRERYFYDEITWENEFSQLKDFFEDKTVGFFGSVGLWHGVYSAGKIGNNFEKLFYEAVKDCDYWKFYDENGHLHLTCSHHDGSCHFEIKEVTDEGIEYLDRWEYSWNDKRSEGYVHNQIMKRYSKLPNYLHKVFGCPKREYEKITKSALIDKLNNEAKSFYCA